MAVINTGCIQPLYKLIISIINYACRCYRKKITAVFCIIVINHIAYYFNRIKTYIFIHINAVVLFHIVKGVSPLRNTPINDNLNRYHKILLI